MATILCAGGAGYIGTHSCIALLQTGHKVIVADDLSNSKKAALDRVQQITGQEIPFYQIDIKNENELSVIFAKHKIDAVIHWAGFKAVGESVEKPLMYYQNNLGCTISLLKVMAEFGAKCFVFSSSATVYDVHNAMPLKEEDVCACTNPYGWTKWMGEQILRDVGKVDAQMSVVLLRYFNPIGAHESGLIGEDPNGIPNNLMPYISQVAVGEREKLSIFGNDYDTPDGTCIRDFIHVMDLAQAHVAAVDYALRNKGVEAFNIGTGRGVSVLELVHAFIKSTGVEIPYEFAPRRAGDLPVCYAEVTKAKEQLGFVTGKTIEQCCEDSYRWQKRNPQGYQES